MMKYVLGIAAVVACLILSTFDSFLGTFYTNVAYWGAAISIIWMFVPSAASKESG